jgi:hypothetical protein
MSPHEAQLKKRLQIALFPQLISHWFPVSQQKPDSVAADLNEMYTPLFAPFVGKRQVLLPHCISATADNDCNLFTDKDGNYLVPLTSRSRFLSLSKQKTETVSITITTPDAGELTWAHVIPVVAKPYKAKIKTQNGKAMISLGKHGAASMIITGKGKEPALPETDFLRLQQACEERFPKIIPVKKEKTQSAPQGTLKSATLTLSGKNFYHAGPFEVSLNGFKCGMFDADSCELSCENISLQNLMNVSVTAADEGSWWLPEKVQLQVETSDGKEYIAKWNRDDEIAAGSTSIKQTLQLKWY